MVARSFIWYDVKNRWTLVHKGRWFDRGLQKKFYHKIQYGPRTMMTLGGDYRFIREYFTYLHSTLATECVSSIILIQLLISNWMVFSTDSYRPNDYWTASSSFSMQTLHLSLWNFVCIFLTQLSVHTCNKT